MKTLPGSVQRWYFIRAKMIFKRKIRHKLPKFPDTIIPLFRSFCEELPVEALEDVRRELENCVLQVEEMSGSNHLIDLRLLHRIAECCRYLLDQYEQFGAHERGLIIGAVRYFVYIDDPLPDDSFSSGLSDDAMVMNHVLDTLGVEDMFIEV